MRDEATLRSQKEQFERDIKEIELEIFNRQQLKEQLKADTQRKLQEQVDFINREIMAFQKNRNKIEGKIELIDDTLRPEPPMLDPKKPTTVTPIQDKKQDGPPKNVKP